MFTVNEYFDGNVKSLAFQGQPLASSLGVMAKGEYKFDTSQKEVMTVVAGQMNVKLPGSNDWQTFNATESFRIDANQSFLARVDADTAYLCTYE
ncbi:MAG: hypothetical protein ACI93R_000795 [Flavobacteriales bacterium]|jgi:uncharacterized protein YaiE (UPF0345 family)